MDPDETLRLARSAWAAGDWRGAADQYSYLDEWISKGGFLPDRWARGHE